MLNYLVRYYTPDMVSAGISVSKTDTKDEHMPNAIEANIADQLFFGSILMQAPVAVCIVGGADFIIEFANEKMYELWQKKASEVINKPLFDVLPELLTHGFKEPLKNVYVTRMPVHAIKVPLTLFQQNKAELKYYDFLFKPRYNAAGGIEGIALISTETTAHVDDPNPKESETQLGMLADFMPQKMTIADKEGNIIYFNKRWLEYTGLGFNEMTGLGWQNAIHPDDRHESLRRWQHSLSTGEDFEAEFRCLHKNGEYFMHFTSGIKVTNESGIIQWICTTAEIEKIRNEDNRKQDFLAMVSHELKTPITSIKAYMQLLISMLKEEHEAILAPVPLKSTLIRIDNLVSRLTRLITAMLDLSRLELGKLELNKELFNINELVTEAVNDIRHASPNQVINIIDDYNCTVNGDKDRLQQVIINLINNAIKYSLENTVVEIHIHMKEPGQVAVSIIDLGIGIDIKDQEKIFDRFYRVGGKAQKTYPGFGIGLFIANEIIKRHNGLITIESEKGKGSVFTFTLPCAASPEAPINK